MQRIFKGKTYFHSIFDLLISTQMETARTLLFSQKSFKISFACLMAAMSPLISLRILNCLGKIFPWASGIFSKQLTLLSSAGVVKWHCLVLQSWGVGDRICRYVNISGWLWTSPSGFSHSFIPICRGTWHHKFPSLFGALCYKLSCLSAFLLMI